MSKSTRKPFTLAEQIESLEPRAYLAGFSAKLYVGNMEQWGPTQTFKVAYTSDQRIRPSSIDNNDILITGPNGYSRLARFVSMVDNKRTIVARYKVSTPRNVWDASTNGTYTINMRKSQVRDITEQYMPGGVLGSFQANLPAFPTAVGEQAFTPQNGATNVINFGANPNDNIDDTDEIQAAIDSLPKANGVPNARDPIGGIVYLPKGTYTISRPLMIFSGVELRGEGVQTVLNGVSGNANDSVMRIYSPHGHGFMTRAAVQNLSISTNVSKGIDVSTANDNGDLIGIRFTNLTISTGGAGIDMRGKDIYQSTVENVTFTNMGSTALALTWTRPAGNSAINSIRNVVVNGVGRNNFVAQEGLVILGGDFNVDGLDIGDIGKRVTPLFSRRGGIFRNVVLRSGASNLPDGFLAKFDDGVFQIDYVENIGPGRALKFTKAQNATINKLKLADNASIANALSIDGTSHVAVTALQSSTLAAVTGIDPRRFSTKSLASIDSSRRANVAVDATVDGPASKLIVDATAFGVRGNDFADDTAALQAAIDSLPRGNGIPGSKGDVGGTVVLPKGRIDLSSTIRIPSGVWLVGQGDGTILYNEASGANDAAIVLTTGAALGYNNGAGIADLALYARDAAGIRADASLTNGVFDLTIDNITLSAGGRGIDLQAVKTYSANINHIAAHSAGSTILWIGDDAGYSADNRTNDIQVYGNDRNGATRPDKALFVFRGENLIENIWIENAYAKLLPFYLSGRANIYGLWLEPPKESLPTGIAAVFENAMNVTIDKMYQVDFNRQLKFVNSNVSINSLNIAGTVNPLQQVLQLDDASRLNLTWVQAIYDVGMADDPRVTIGGAYNQNAGQYVDYDKVIDGTNLLQNIDNWQIQWGDTLGAVQGNAIVEQTSTGPRLKITVTSNPNNRPVLVTINANVPKSAQGKPAAASWRIDGGSAETLVWTRNYASQFQAREQNSATIVPMPGVLSGNDQILILMNKLSAGTVYVSNVRLVALA